MASVLSKKERGYHFLPGLYNRRYLILIITLIFNMVVPSSYDSHIGRIINLILLFLLVNSSLFFIQHSKKLLHWFLIFAVVSFVFESLGFDGNPDKVWRGIIRFTASFVFIFMLSLNLMSDMLNRQRVDLNMVMGAISGYFLLALNASYIFIIIESFTPYSFLIDGIAAKPFELLYFAIVTITTTGYGDVLPISEVARRATMFFAVAGQIYTTVVLAVIVAKYISHSDKKSEE